MIRTQNLTVFLVFGQLRWQVPAFQACTFKVLGSPQTHSPQESLAGGAVCDTLLPLHYVIHCHLALLPLHCKGSTEPLNTLLDVNDQDVKLKSDAQSKYISESVDVVMEVVTDL